jgi:putative component of membrane protein insertase Oxa1/YidC/SpoIIIJ protein YidD
MEAFTEHGFWTGLSLTARRLIRCRPFGPHGVDLVPLHGHSSPSTGKARAA